MFDVRFKWNAVKDIRTWFCCEFATLDKTQCSERRTIIMGVKKVLYAVEPYNILKPKNKNLQIYGAQSSWRATSGKLIKKTPTFIKLQIY
jgi:hypothetical protein